VAWAQLRRSKTTSTAHTPFIDKFGKRERPAYETLRSWVTSKSGLQGPETPTRKTATLQQDAATSAANSVAVCAHRQRGGSISMGEYDVTGITTSFVIIRRASFQATNSSLHRRRPSLSSFSCSILERTADTRHIVAVDSSAI